MKKNQHIPIGYTPEEYGSLCAAERGIKNNEYIPPNASNKLVMAHLRRELRDREEIERIEEVRKRRLFCKS